VLCWCNNFLTVCTLHVEKKTNKSLTFRYIPTCIHTHTHTHLRVRTKKVSLDMMFISSQIAIIMGQWIIEAMESLIGNYGKEKFWLFASYCYENFRFSFFFIEIAIFIDSIIIESINSWCSLLSFGSFFLRPWVQHSDVDWNLAVTKPEFGVENSWWRSNKLADK
jgi:hypothetical protein